MKGILLQSIRVHPVPDGLSQNNVLASGRDTNQCRAGLAAIKNISIGLSGLVDFGKQHVSIVRKLGQSIHEQIDVEALEDGGSIAITPRIAIAGFFSSRGSVLLGIILAFSHLGAFVIAAFEMIQGLGGVFGRFSQDELAMIGNVFAAVIVRVVLIEVAIISTFVIVIVIVVADYYKEKYFERAGVGENVGE